MARSCACGEPIREEDLEAPLLDLEEGTGHGHTAAPPQPTPPPPPGDATESDVAMEKAFGKMIRCTARTMLMGN
ncbi:hypothetical protein EJB05_28770 [Eragrostis curvula]|uniref:Uncharacterized protein n=1 Tax=Eragrostis curvula TaxID=38414 RepID=A0A5J9SUX1_9POAL|nr:hypothetical protein EJB05_51706 [Eragrostis curvula]TVU26233.1 hypothetical protein EJB05_28770 [Eragrostis curvula]